MGESCKNLALDNGSKDGNSLPQANSIKSMRKSLSLVRRLALLGVLGIVVTHGNAQPTNSAATTNAAAKPDPWKPMRVFVGTWAGEAKGESGDGKSEREYKFVLNNRFIQVSNRTTYPAQSKNPKGEQHEDMGLFSYDRSAKKFVLRQFHTEGFVNHYVQENISPDQRTFTFASTAIENIPAGWRARETYKFTGDDEFTETFELAEPGKEFKVYSETRYRRKK
jgi:hypothetical protein